MVARLSRIVPLLIVLAVVASIVYLVATYRYSPSRAKQILVKMFTWITGVLSAFFLLVTLYALFEDNAAVFDLAASFLATAAIGLAITRICNAVFLKRHPEYKHKPIKATRKAKAKTSDSDAVRSILQAILRQLLRNGRR